MNKIIKRFSILFILSIAFFITSLTLLIIPSHYDLIVPASTYDIRNVYSFEGVDTTDVNVNSVSVYSYYEISMLNYIVSNLNPYAVIDEHNDYVITSNDYAMSSGNIQKIVSVNNSLICGYKKAGKDIKYYFRGDIVHTIFSGATIYFQIGDIITEVEGTKITEEINVNRIIIEKYGVIEIDGAYYLNLNKDDILNFKLLRNNEELEINVKPLYYEEGNLKIYILGINTYDCYGIDSENTTPKYHINYPDSYGPSAGFMQALFIYDALSKEKLTKDLKIVGTGTIDINGNVGSIGGVESKLVAAEASHADIFFVPEANYQEALQRYNKHNYKLDLVKVKTFDDCLNYLRQLKGVTV